MQSNLQFYQPKIQNWVGNSFSNKEPQTPDSKKFLSMTNPLQQQNVDQYYVSNLNKNFRKNEEQDKGSILIIENDQKPKSNVLHLKNCRQQETIQKGNSNEILSPTNFFCINEQERNHVTQGSNLLQANNQLLINQPENTKNYSQKIQLEIANLGRKQNNQCQLYPINQEYYSMKDNFNLNQEEDEEDEDDEEVNDDNTSYEQNFIDDDEEICENFKQKIEHHYDKSVANKIYTFPRKYSTSNEWSCAFDEESEGNFSENSFGEGQYDLHWQNLQKEERKRMVQNHKEYLGQNSAAFSTKAQTLDCLQKSIQNTIIALISNSNPKNVSSEQLLPIKQKEKQDHTNSIQHSNKEYLKEKRKANLNHEKQYMDYSNEKQSRENKLSQQSKVQISISKTKELLNNINNVISSYKAHIHSVSPNIMDMKPHSSQIDQNKQLDNSSSIFQSLNPRLNKNQFIQINENLINEYNDQEKQQQLIEQKKSFARDIKSSQEQTLPQQNNVKVNSPVEKNLTSQRFFLLPQQMNSSGNLQQSQFPQKKQKTEGQELQDEQREGKYQEKVSINNRESQFSNNLANTFDKYLQKNLQQYQLCQNKSPKQNSNSNKLLFSSKKVQEMKNHTLKLLNQSTQLQRKPYKNEDATNLNQMLHIEHKKIGSSIFNQALNRTMPLNQVQSFITEEKLPSEIKKMNPMEAKLINTLKMNSLPSQHPKPSFLYHTKKISDGVSASLNFNSASDINLNVKEIPPAQKQLKQSTSSKGHIKISETQEIPSPIQIKNQIIQAKVPGQRQNSREITSKKRSQIRNTRIKGEGSNPPNICNYTTNEQKSRDRTSSAQKNLSGIVEKNNKVHQFHNPFSKGYKNKVKNQSPGNLSIKLKKERSPKIQEPPNKSNASLQLLDNTSSFYLLTKEDQQNKNQSKQEICSFIEEIINKKRSQEDNFLLKKLDNQSSFKQLEFTNPHQEISKQAINEQELPQHQKQKQLQNKIDLQKNSEQSYVQAHLIKQLVQTQIKRQRELATNAQGIRSPQSISNKQLQQDRSEYNNMKPRVSPEPTKIDTSLKAKQKIGTIIKDILHPNRKEQTPDSKIGTKEKGEKVGSNRGDQSKHKQQVQVTSTTSTPSFNFYSYKK